jgi:hypothetical protein
MADYLDAMNRERRHDAVKRAVATLAEEWECVQVFVSRYEGNEGTASFTWGAGNGFAREGQVSDWIEAGGLPRSAVPIDDDGDDES